MKKVQLSMATMSLVVLINLAQAPGPDIYAEKGGRDAFEMMVQDPSSAPANYFTENLGQWDESVLFHGRCAFGSVTIHDEGVTYSIEDGTDPRTLEIGFQGGRVCSVTTDGCLGFKTNYIIGDDPAEWGIGARNFQEVVLEDVWEDVDLRYRFAPGGIKYDVVLGPGSDHRDVMFEVKGQSGLESDISELTISVPGGNALTDSELIATDDGDVRLPVRFKVLNGSCYGFDLDRPAGSVVTIDPLVSSTYIGGSYDDSAVVAMDPDGCFYLVGETGSPDYPVTPGALSGSRSGDYDICVTKLDRSANAIVYSTYIGGSNFEFSPCAFADEFGFLYVTGETCSVDFPTTEGAFREHNVNTYYNDIFALKLNVSGDRLIASTYISGDWYESTNDIHVQDGAVYLCGQMESHDFPSENGPVGGVHGTAFFLMMDENLTRITDSAFWDTPGSETAICLDVDGNGTVVIGGTSSDPFFPVTPGTYSTDPRTMMGPSVFIVKYCPSNGTQIFSSMIGGNSSDIISGLEMDSKGDIYFAGSTFGYGTNHFPTTKGSFDTVMNGTRDGFLAKLSCDGRSLLFSTLLGGDSEDYLRSLSLDSADRPAVAGITRSTTGLPVTEGAVQMTLKGDFDCLITVMVSDGSRVVFSTYLGGSSEDSLLSLVAVGTDRLVVSGTTSSNDFPTVKIPLMGNNSGNYDIFLTVMGYDSIPDVPTGLKATANGGSILLSWDPPRHTGNIPVINYSIYRGRSLDNMTLLIRKGNVTEHNDQSIDYGQVYYYRVSASNLLGEGPKSVPAFNRTITRPDPPSNFTARAGVDHMELTWECPTFTGGIPLSGFLLYRSGPNGSMYLLARLGPLDRVHIDEEIMDGSVYTYNLSACNEIGPSVQNATVTVRALTVPTPPRDLELEGGDGVISLSWQPPIDDNGSPLIRYRIYRTYDDDETLLHSTVPPEVRDFDDLYLENGRRYSYRITAENIKGESPPSNTRSTFPRTFPSAPTGLTWVLIGGLVRVEWGPPEDDGGMDVLGYTVMTGPEKGGLVMVSEQTPHGNMSYLDPTPCNGSIRFYSVSCHTAVGPSRTAAIVMVPGHSVPSSPLDLKAVPGDSSVGLTWDIPSTDGGAPVLGYRVHRSVGGDGPSIIALVNADGPLSYDDRGLTNGVPCKYWIDAINVVGASPLSEPVSSKPVGLPGPPQNLTLVESDMMIIVSWDGPDYDGGSAVNGYRVMRGREGDGLITIGTCAPERRALNDTGLTNGEVYLYAVYSISEAGMSELSEVHKASPCSVPGKVQRLRAVLDSNDVLIEWSPPADTGGRPVLGYEISRRSVDTGHISILDALSTNTTYLDIGPSSGVTYEYSIVPFNIVGRGEMEARTVTVPVMGEDDGKDRDLLPYIGIGVISFILMISTILVILRMHTKKKGMIDVELWGAEGSEE